MALSDPQTITIATVAQTLNLIETQGLSSTYRTSDGVWELKISHQTVLKNRTRRLVRLNKYFLDSLGAQQFFSFYVNIEEPSGNVATDTAIKDGIAGFITWFTSTIQDKILGDQH